MNNGIQDYIDIEYERIINELNKSKLFDEPIDIQNYKMVVVASHGMGYSEHLRSSQSHEEFVEDFKHHPFSRKNLWWKFKFWLKGVILYKIHLYS